jgi:hypothetical protein
LRAAVLRERTSLAELEACRREVGQLEAEAEQALQVSEGTEEPVFAVIYQELKTLHLPEPHTEAIIGEAAEADVLRGPEVSEVTEG